jgi:tRNA (guanine10-N2)-dimethyltransferase
MKYLFELSKDHETFPISEVHASLNSENINFSVLVSNNDIILIESDADEDKIRRVAKRLSFTYFIDEFFFRSKPDINDIEKHTLQNTIKKKGSIAIKYKNRSRKVNSQQIVKKLASVYTKNRKVKLTDSDIEIRSLITDSQVYVGRKLFKIDRSQFEKRKVQFRPFFSPISLHPRIARVLVNLSNIKKDEILLDPFCGTGGILLEAGLIGAKVVGNDIEEKMIDGCRKTLDYYGIKNYDLFCSDIGDIHKYFRDVDAVVTDLPYGKSTTTKGEDMKNLYSRAFQSISSVLKTGGRALIGISRNDLINLGKKYLSHVETHKFRAHRSLTRYFVVFKK